MDVPAAPRPHLGLMVQIHLHWVDRQWQGLHSWAPWRRPGFSEAVSGLVCGQAPRTTWVDRLSRAYLTQWGWGPWTAVGRTSGGTQWAKLPYELPPAVGQGDPWRGPPLRVVGRSGFKGHSGETPADPPLAPQASTSQLTPEEGREVGGLRAEPRDVCTRPAAPGRAPDGTREGRGSAGRWAPCFTHQDPRAGVWRAMPSQPWDPPLPTPPGETDMEEAAEGLPGQRGGCAGREPSSAAGTPGPLSKELSVLP